MLINSESYGITKNQIIAGLEESLTESAETIAAPVLEKR